MFLTPALFIIIFYVEVGAPCSQDADCNSNICDMDVCSDGGEKLKCKLFLPMFIILSSTNKPPILSSLRLFFAFQISVTLVMAARRNVKPLLVRLES